MPIHPDVANVLEVRGRVELSSMGVAEARETHLKGSTAGPIGPDMADIANLTLADVPVRSYRPHNRSGAAIVYFHGGGWVLGSIDTHDRQCRHLAAGSGATVFNVGYRLAPEYPFPAAYDDAMAVTSQIVADGWALTIDPQRVALAGDSAGGNLAAAVAIALRTSDGPSLQGQLLIYPALDAAMSSASFVENAGGPFLSAADMTWFYNLYRNGIEDSKAEAAGGGAVGATSDVPDWKLSPLHAPDLSGLPPTLVITAELDPLRDEGEAYAQRLSEANVSAIAVRYAGVCHGFFGWSHLAEPSRQAMAQATHWLSEQLAGDR